MKALVVAWCVMVAGPSVAGAQARATQAFVGRTWLSTDARGRIEWTEDGARIPAGPDSRPNPASRR
jgi:hypothetical protein